MFMKFILVLFFSSMFLFAQEGPVKSHYANGEVESEITYSDGIRDGIARYYYPNGVLKEELSYKNGRVEGDVKRYYQNGKLKESFFIEDGRRSGSYISINEDSTKVKSLAFEEGIQLIVPKEEPAPQVVASTDKKTAKYIKVKKNLTYEEKVVATLNAAQKPVVDSLPIDAKSGYYTSVMEMPAPIIGYDSLQKKLVYTPEAKKHEIHGTVVLYAYVDENGDVTKTEIVKSLVYGLDEAAQVAVYYTRFKPGKQAGVPQKVKTLMSLEFK